VQTYLVEHYRPGLKIDGLREAAALVRAAAMALGREGSSLRYVHSTIVPTDEAFLTMFEAASEGAVREAYARASLPFDRISIAIPEESS
jgi:hypothetical protein